VVATRSRTRVSDRKEGISSINITTGRAFWG
jgi:hypothetical protein